MLGYLRVDQTGGVYTDMGGQYLQSFLGSGNDFASQARPVVKAMENAGIGRCKIFFIFFHFALTGVP